MTKTVYERNKSAWDDLARVGFPALSEMARHFSSQSEMDRALGYVNAVSKWQSRAPSGARPGRKAEQYAREWLDSRRVNVTATALPAPKASNPGGDLLLVCIPDGKAEKARRVLEMLGCEVVDF